MSSLGGLFGPPATSLRISQTPARPVRRPLGAHRNLRAARRCAAQRCTHLGFVRCHAPRTGASSCSSAACCGRRVREVVCWPRRLRACRRLSRGARLPSAVRARLLDLVCSIRREPYNPIIDSSLLPSISPGSGLHTYYSTSPQPRGLVCGRRSEEPNCNPCLPRSVVSAIGESPVSSRRLDGYVSALTVRGPANGSLYVHIRKVSEQGWLCSNAFARPMTAPGHVPRLTRALYLLSPSDSFFSS